MPNDFIPFEKMFKKQQREINRQKRTTWGNLNPTTRSPKNSRAYDRSKEKARVQHDSD